MKTSKLPVKVSARRAGSLPPARTLGSPSDPDLTEHPLRGTTLSDGGDRYPGLSCISLTVKVPLCFVLMTGV